MQKFSLFLFFLFLSTTFCFANTVQVEQANDLIVDEQEAKENKSKAHESNALISKGSERRQLRSRRYSKRPLSSPSNSWSPFLVNNKSYQSTPVYFFQVSLGLGFLRFAGLKGRLLDLLSLEINEVEFNRDIQGRLCYTRTPLTEVNLGTQPLSWLALALAYQHQGVVEIASSWQEKVAVFDEGELDGFLQQQFTANLRLDALFLKLFFNPPKSLIIKGIGFCPYLGIGVGPSWQTWTRLQIHRSVTGSDAGQGDGGSLNAILPYFKNKYSANCFYTFDLGINMRSFFPNLQFAVNLGCKYNAWGQARQMGKLTQQKPLNQGLFKPISIRSIYQFAPYLGVQWSY